MLLEEILPIRELKTSGLPTDLNLPQNRLTEYMSVNQIITLSLTMTLAFVLLMRRSLASRLTSWSTRLPGRTAKSRRRPTGTTVTDAAPRRMRPMLALSVSALPSHGAIRGAGDHPPTTNGAVTAEEVPEASALPDVLEHVPREAHERGRAGDEPHEGGHAARADRGPVNAPGWPSPGELAGMCKLDGFDSLLAQDEATETADALGGDAQPFENPSWLAGDDDRSGSAMPVPNLVRRDEQFETTSAGDTVATLIAPTAVAAVWDEVDEDREETTGGAQPTSNPVHWEWGWNSSGDPDSSSEWVHPIADVPSGMSEDPVDPPAEAAPREAPQVRIVDMPLWTGTVDPADMADRLARTDHTRVVASAVGEFVASERAEGASAPVIVVVIPETRATPTDREDKLARAVRRLEKRVAALTAPTPAPAKRVDQPPRAKRSPATTAFELTQVEDRELRALAARRSAPIRARRGARIVLATARGLDVPTIARRVGVHSSTVRRWQARFSAQRLAALDSAHQRGIPGQ